MSIEIDTFDAPAYWASAFVNGDTSGLEEADLADFEAWCAENPELCNVVDCSEESWFGQFHFDSQGTLGCDLLTYTCHILENSDGS